MKDLLNVIKTASQEIDEVVVLFSTGKDSIVTLDLCCKYFKKVKACHWYSVKGYSFTERIIDYYSKRYGIEIIQIPYYNDLTKIVNAGNYLEVENKMKNSKQSDTIKYTRLKTGIEYVAFGYREDEGMRRRAIIKKYSDNGIDRKFKKLYPMWHWRNPDVWNYLKQEKLILPDTYKYGFRDIGFPIDESLLFLYNNFPKDYERAVSQYPMLEAELERVLEKC